MATPTPTSPTPGESELDTSSSINNLSSILAEKGTVTSGTGEDDIDIETSSIEQLDWSEADEEELQQQELAAAAASTTPPTKPINNKVTLEAVRKISPSASSSSKKEPDVVADEIQGNKVGRPLSSSLLESMSSTVDSDVSSKKSVIENWASDVKDAVERGEMEIEEESAEDLINDEEDKDSDEEMTVDEGDNNEGIRMRKRIKLSTSKDPMSMSSISSFAVDSNIDPLSNAVLDDGPIWNKGPKLYRFQENRRFNQKLTFGVLLAVVLAIGLGLGNLVAYNECEAEYKAAQPKLQQKSSQQQQQRIRSPQASKTAEFSLKNDEIPSSSPLPQPMDNSNNDPQQRPIPDLKSIPVVVETPLEVETEPITKDVKKDEEPSLDAKYGVHMETLSKIVKTLDHLQRKIDKFENTSRGLGGVVVLKDTEDEPPLKSKAEGTSLLEEQIHEEYLLDERNDEESAIDDEVDEDELMKDYDEGVREDLIDRIINGIEETLGYAKYRNNLIYNRELDSLEEEENEQKFGKSTTYVTDEFADFHRKVKAYFEVAKMAEEEFIRKERDELRERKVLGLAEDRKPEEYSTEEREELEIKYTKYMEQFSFESERVNKYAEQLKKAKESDLDEEELFQHFFDDFDDAAYQIQELLGDESEDFTKEVKVEKYPGSIEQVVEQESRRDLQVEPRKELVPTADEQKTVKEEVPIVEKVPSKTSPEINVDNPWQDFSKGDEEEIVDKHMKREKSPKKEYTKTKSDKRRKNFKRQDNFNDIENGQEQLKIDKKFSYGKPNKKENQENDNDDSFNYKHKKSDKKRRNSKEYKETKEQQWNDFDYDDDDHKRKKYSDTNNKENDNKNNNDQPHYHHRRGQKDGHSDWLLERTKAREDNSHDLGDKGNSEFNQYTSSGKKVNNWQVERDRIRSKNQKNKSYDH